MIVEEKRAMRTEEEKVLGERAMMMKGTWGTRWGRNGAGVDGPTEKEVQRPSSIFCFEEMLDLMIKSLMLMMLMMRMMRLKREEG